MPKGTRRTQLPILGVVLLVAATATCDPPFEPLVGDLTFSLVTTGTDLDPDGYDVRIDGGLPQAVSTNGSLTVVALVGQHSVTLEGLAVNCIILGSATRTVDVSTGDAAVVSYQVRCSAPFGTIVVQTSTTGAKPDTNGYVVTVDSGPGHAVPMRGVAVIPDVPVGDHLVTLGGVAGNCSVVSTNPLPVSVSFGGIAYASFGVTCVDTTGLARVNIATSGTDFDPTGYTLVVDEGVPRPVAVNSVTIVPDLPPGDHSFYLTDIAGNCAVGLANPLTATVVVGHVVIVSFDLTCVSAYGAVRVATTTTGIDIDPDGYLVHVDSAPLQATGVNGIVTVGSVPPGDRGVELLGVEPNCTATPAVDTVAVVIGDTVDVAFAVACASKNGALQVIVATGGVSLDPDGYTVLVDYSCDYYYGCYYLWSETVAVNDTVTIAPTPTGTHTVWLEGASRNCSIAGQNPRDAAVPPAGLATVQFDVTCAPAGTLQVGATTSGVDPDPNGYLVTVDNTPIQSVPANGAVSIEFLGEGDHTVTLSDVAGNCIVQGGATQVVHITADSTTNLAFTVTCVSHLGTLLVTVVTTGVNPDSNGYVVQVDYVCDYYYYNCYYLWSVPVAANDTIAIAAVPMGGHYIALDSVALNCTAPPNQAVYVPPSDTGRITLTVTCVQVGSLRAPGRAPGTGGDRLGGFDAEPRGWVRAAREP